MKTCRTSILSVSAFLLLLCSFSVASQVATACPVEYSGPTSFTATAGTSQTLTWTVTGYGSTTALSITEGSEVFSVDQSEISIPANGASFTITFKPGPNASGTLRGTLHCSECNKSFQLVGTVATSGVANILPSTVTVTISPNPATDNIRILSTGIRSVQIRLYDLLGKELASSKVTNSKLDASSLPAGVYNVRITGESETGEKFAIWRRIIIAR